MLKLTSYFAIISIIFAYIFNLNLCEINGLDLYLLDALIFFYVFSFGIYRFFTEKNHFQKIRIHVIVWLYMVFWGVMPFFLGMTTSGISGINTPWPGIHVIGSYMFFIYGFAMIFFGRRIDCGWNCPCVATRETVGFAFRDKTIRTSFWWNLRFIKYLFLAFLIFYLFALFFLSDEIKRTAGHYYYSILKNSYYLGFIFVPFLGNRIYCRLLCPYAALWGIYSYLGFYKIIADSAKCTNCKLCEKVCDMCIPITDFVKKGEINTVECMGCERCIDTCPHNVLKVQRKFKI